MTGVSFEYFSLRSRTVAMPYTITNHLHLAGVLVANGCCGILENSLFDGATKDFTNVYSVSAFRTAEEEKATAEELVNHFCETPRIPGCFTSMAISKNSGRPLPAAGGRSGYQVPCILCATP